ncbi:hypothetical protein [Methylobacterium sp. CM6257]
MVDEPSLSASLITPFSNTSTEAYLTSCQPSFEIGSPYADAPVAQFDDAGSSTCRDQAPHGGNRQIRHLARAAEAQNDWVKLRGYGRAQVACGHAVHDDLQLSRELGIGPRFTLGVSPVGL